MDLTPYLSSLRQDLATAAQAGDDNTRRSATVLGAAIEPAARLALMNALSDMAAEVTSQLPGHTVDVRLSGRDVKVVVTPLSASATSADSANSAGSADAGGGAADAGTRERSESPGGPSTGDTMADATGDISRVTLRLVEEMKARAEQAAAAQGVSLNSFVSQALQGALSGGHRRSGSGSGGPGGPGGPGGSGGSGDDGPGLRGWAQW